MPLDKPLNILVVYDFRGNPQNMRVAIKHHLHALDYSDLKHNIVYYNAGNDAPSNDITLTPSDEMPLWLQNYRFDLVILHNTFLGYRWGSWYFYHWKKRFSWIAKLDCIKLAMPQDEYDHAEILDEWLFTWNINIVLSLHDEIIRQPLYSLITDRVNFYQALTGYIDQETASRYSQKLLPLSQRRLDIVYRANHLPYWFGSFGQMKHNIAGIIGSSASERGYLCDISTNKHDVIVGEKWLDFIASSKTVIGIEGGSSVIDRRGEIQAQIRNILSLNSSISFAEVDKQMPEGWNSFLFAAITPRNFEAVILKTCQILIRGHYNGILVAGKHYIPVEEDFSNLEDVLKKIRDYDYIQAIADDAYQDIYLNGHYTSLRLAQQIEQAVIDYREQHLDEKKVNIMGKSDEAIAALERQLVAERHHNALLEAKLQQPELRLLLYALSLLRKKRYLAAFIVAGIFMLLLMIACVAIISTWLAIHFVS